MGRPRKYKTSDDLEKKIEEYFAMCDKKGKPYTVTGLGLYIGLDRKGIVEYGENKEYSNAIKKAKLMIENYAEEQLFTAKNVTGIIFNLKNNWNWTDKQEIETTGETTVNNKIDFSNLTTEQIRELLKNED